MQKKWVISPQFQNVLLLIGILYVIFRIGTVCFQNKDKFLTGYYTEDYYKMLESLFLQSQYRQKNPTSIIPDEVVFSYAAGAYMQGIDPIRINAETQPLGKYIIGASILFFKNDTLVIPFFGIVSLIAVWMLAKSVLKNNVLAIIPVAGLVSEKLFLDQFRIVPLMDIIQLPFILFSLYFFTIERKKDKYVVTAVLLGLTAAVKSVVPAILLLFAFSVFFILKQRLVSLFRFFVFFPIAAVCFCLTYLRTFLSGYTLADFIGFQKWIFLYQQSKLIYPFSLWSLIYRNRWQAWWGDKGILHASDWQVTWPIVTTLFFVMVIVRIVLRRKTGDAMEILMVFGIMWFCFLSLGVVSSRFLLPVLPICYIVSTYLILCGRRMEEKKNA
jgi:hypothetical protein